MDEIYDIKVVDRMGNEHSMSEYRGKTLLIVNTATGCGFTPQYEGLEKAPGTAEEIHEFCQLKYDTSFPQFAKIEVNGANEHPLYSFLKSQKGGLLGKKIKWNFTKFLIDKNGNVIERFAPTVKPEDIDEKISAVL